MDEILWQSCHFQQGTLLINSSLHAALSEHCCQTSLLPWGKTWHEQAATLPSCYDRYAECHANTTSDFILTENKWIIQSDSHCLKTTWWCSAWLAINFETGAIHSCYLKTAKCQVETVETLHRDQLFATALILYQLVKFWHANSS